MSIMSKVGKTDLVYIMAEVVKIRVRGIDEFRALVADAGQRQERELRELVETLREDEDGFYYSDEVSRLKQIESLSDRLSIVALYIIVEESVKWIHGQCCGPSEARREEGIGAAHNHFQQMHGINLEAIEGRADIRVLKELNNEIKHDPSSAIFKSLEGTAYSSPSDCYERISRVVESYIRTLAKQAGVKYASDNS